MGQTCCLKNKNFHHGIQNIRFFFALDFCGQIWKVFDEIKRLKKYGFNIRKLFRKKNNQNEPIGYSNY